MNMIIAVVAFTIANTSGLVVYDNFISYTECYNFKAYYDILYRINGYYAEITCMNDIIK